MFYDLNIPWNSDAQELSQIANFSDELGYNVIALNHTIAGKVPADLSCPIPEDPVKNGPKDLKYLRRCTLIFSDPSQNYRLAALASTYDLLALRPTTEKAFLQACAGIDHVSLISIDMTQRQGYHFRSKSIAVALAKGIRFELCYAPSVLSTDSSARRNLISNATQMIRASRGRGIVLSSEASSCLGIRAPIDVTNLASVWGLSQEKSQDALSREPHSLTSRAAFMRRSYRGVIDMVDVGTPPMSDVTQNLSAKNVNNLKRKSDDAETSSPAQKPLSKREQKRRAKQARLQKVAGSDSVETPVREGNS